MWSVVTASPKFSKTLAFIFLFLIDSFSLKNETSLIYVEFLFHLNNDDFFAFKFFQ